MSVLLLSALAAASVSHGPCNPCEDVSGCCGGVCCDDERQPYMARRSNTVLKSSVAARHTDVNASAPPHPDEATRRPSVAAMANWTTVFRVGERGFGCMRFPQLHHANNTLYMFVECCECARIKPQSGTNVYRLRLDTIKHFKKQK